MAEKRAQTMSLKGNDYAKVAERLKLFWEDHPNGKIDTKHFTSEKGTVEFVTRVWKDKKDFINLLANGATEEIALLSSDANGTAQASATKIANEKGFEKLETVATGRALANLGYLASGEVASSEEMEEFQEYKQEKAAEAVQNALDELESAKTMEELKDKFSSLPRELWANKDVVAKKDELKKKLMEKKDESNQNLAK